MHIEYLAYGPFDDEMWFMVQNKQRVLDESGVGIAAAPTAAAATSTAAAAASPLAAIHQAFAAPAAPSPPPRSAPLSHRSPPSTSPGDAASTASTPEARKRRFGDIHTATSTPPAVPMPMSVLT